MSAPVAHDEEVRRRVRRRFRDEDDVKRTPAETLRRLLVEEDPLLDGATVGTIVGALEAELVGLGVLDRFWCDPVVTDVLVNGDGSVWVERGGELARTELRIEPDEVVAIVERALGPLGLRADRSRPIADGRLPDGSRVHVVVPPVAVDGPCVSIRRFAASPFRLDQLADPVATSLLDDAVVAGRNIVVFGSTGSGKTTLLNALAGRIPDGQRLVTVEDSAELRLGSSHVVRLESRPANGDGVGEVVLRDLVRAALRMRPDRIVVGEVRGPEAFDMVWAMSTGHGGCLSTIHASSASDALMRLETFVAMADASLPFEVARRQVVAAVDLVVGMARIDGGRRQVRSIHAVVDDSRSLVARWPSPSPRDVPPSGKDPGA